jgi:hypothetical protein
MDKREWSEKLPKWLMRWMASLLPTQTSSGAGAVNIGQVNGDVTHITNRVEGSAPSQTHIDNSQRQVTMHVTQNFYSAQVQDQPAANGTATPEQREVLRMLSRMPNRGESVFKFMETNFNTRMVIDLRPGELKRVQAYIASINRRMASRPTQGTTC